MIAMVGMLVAAAVAALLGFGILVAKRVDQESALREVDLVRRQLAELQTKVRVDLATFTRWDPHLDPTSDYFDHDWAHRYFGLRLQHDRGHNRSFILGQTGNPVYSSADGVMVDGDLFRRMQRPVDSLIDAVRRAQAASDIEFSPTLRVRGEAPVRPKFEVTLRRVEGRPAVVGVATIVPGGGRDTSASPTPPVAVTVAFLGREMLQRIAQEIATDSVVVHDGALSEEVLAGGKIAAEIPLGTDETKAWLVWSPRAPGQTMLLHLLPGLLACRCASRNRNDGGAVLCPPHDRAARSKRAPGD